MGNIKDENGHNQIFSPTNSTLIRQERRANWFIELMDISKKADVLEIGCGTGRMAYLIASKTESEIIGTDISLPFVNEARNNYSLPNLKYMFLDFNEPAVLQGKKFDYIIGNGILHHLYYNLDNSILKIKELLKENGKMIFMEPNIYNPYVALIFTIPFLRKMTHLEPDEMAFSKSYIAKKLNVAGFKTIEVEYKDFLLPGIPDILIKPSIFFGNIFEKLPIINKVSQSILIVGQK